MGKYFTLDELTRSDEAAGREIGNVPPPEVTARLNGLIDAVLDPIREMWGSPIYVNSGYRSPMLNRAVGGLPSSQHIRGEAADISAGNPERNKELFGMIVRSAIVFDQLIDEKDYRWLHVSYTAGVNRKQVLHL